MFESTGCFHRVPIGFGPAPGPRQDENGAPFTTWNEARAELTGVVCNVDRSALQALLPDGYAVEESVQPTLVFEFMGLRNLPWLAGRGYNTWGVYANNVICNRADPPIKASYLLVLFESFSDPITTGREELGWPKVWAELPDGRLEDGRLVQTASWFGNEFMRLEIPNLSFKPISEAQDSGPRDYTLPSVDGILHHRYVPAVGDRGKHDASYATFQPGGGAAKSNVRSYATTTGPLSEVTLTITESPWKELPTLWNIVKGLCTLKAETVREVYHEVKQGASDGSTLKRIEK